MPSACDFGRQGALYPGMGSVDVQEARGKSTYHSMQAEASRRFSNGVYFTASYTFSKTIDDGNGAFGGAQNYRTTRVSGSTVGWRIRTSGAVWFLAESTSYRLEGAIFRRSSRQDA